MDRLAAAHELLRSRVGSGHSENPADPSTVQAMQIALHLPKANPPSQTAVLEAAAMAVVALCLDERASAQWQAELTQWYDHLIRKVARRARNKAWQDVQEVPGVTITHRGAQARAFVPSAVHEVPSQVAKLQIRATELEADDPGEIDPQLPLIVVDKDLCMSTGKAAAQVGHASMLLAANQPIEWVRRWKAQGFALQVRQWPREKMKNMQADVVVRDAGFTEVAPDSITAIASLAPNA